MLRHNHNRWLKISTQARLFEVSKSIQFRIQYPRFILAKAVELLDKELLERIKAFMNQKGYSDKIINSTRLENIQLSMDRGEITYDIVSDYTTVKGFDVSRAREKGTKRHFIKPIKKLVLTWVIFGVRFFSRGHFVSGIERTLLIQKTMDAVEPLIQQKLDQETERFFSDVMGKQL